MSVSEFFGGFGLGMVFVLVLLELVPMSAHRMAKDALHECEKTLPRDQKCTVIAVPKAGEK